MKDIGIILQQARESQNIAISEASDALKIKQRYLEAIEVGDTSELAGGAYLNGCIKSYANWLGLNGVEITSKFKKESTQLKIGGSSISTDGSSIFASESKVLFPGAGLSLGSFVVALVTCLLWLSYNERNYIIDSAKILQNEIKFNYPGFAYLHNNDKKIILLANDKAMLTVTDVSGNKEFFQLEKEQIFYLPQDKNVFLSADKPEYVDVFLDDSNNKFLGTLKNIEKL